MRSVRLALLVLVPILLAACGGTSKTTEKRFVGLAFASSEARSLGLPKIFPRTPSTVPCVLGVRLTGTCRTAVDVKSAHEAVVTLAETWDARNFRANNDPRSGPIRYSWVFTIDDRNLGEKVVSLATSGDLPPQLSPAE